mgnify:CR=1 FL=1
MTLNCSVSQFVEVITVITVDCSNLLKEMSIRGISLQEIAALLNESEDTVASRIQGRTEWIYEEVITIRNAMFPECELHYLFRPEVM